ncbi:cryptococcal mannosyltransferase 1-domain-containing protein [Microdochium trichocladiopsis]|uniref:Cryptococcal mannosyltransferase 1-domain-containing protein n=1 Tax=Microdochium trichocladiopsis TaxID=1682393 RepID=A0A9P9BS67_9PEZI|nr:cryptococcal mannosyltransferase 1-domain-containing protein [Microdochium trichocladiopsis]KAH7028015.1 cryptococcal mannosyltransferase 1-domain-containing protein [Microdochium trichocladiopsis]
MPRNIAEHEESVGLLDDSSLTLEAVVTTSSTASHGTYSSTVSSSSSVCSDDFEGYIDEPKFVAFKKPRWHDSFAGWCRSRPRHVRRKFRRPRWVIVGRLLRYLFLAICALIVVTPIFASSYTKPPAQYGDLELRCHGPRPPAGCANPHNEKVFIAISLYDKGGHLAGGMWGANLLQLIHLIGEKNVFLSIYENNSGPEGEAALESFKRRLRCRHHIVIDSDVPLSDFEHQTIVLPDGSKRLKRLAYLSEMRNRALRPLDTFNTEDGIVEYDRILFMNDVAFRPTDAANLLFSTNVGPDGKAQYLSACGLDFMSPFLFYDLYAMRDAEGFSNGLPIFPIFSNAGQGISRAAMVAGSDAVPVSSCWGGIVAMDARYVQNRQATLPSPTFQDIGSHVIDPNDPTNATAPVRFRYEPEIFFDACECCLFLADVSQAARKDNAKEVGVYVNPYVRVAYDFDTLGWLPWVKHWERLFSIPQRILSPALGLPTHNPHRTVQEGDSFKEEIWVGEGDEGHWKTVDRIARNGMFCGVREMQALQIEERTEDKNWENFEIPGGQTLYFPT